MCWERDVVKLWHQLSRPGQSFLQKSSNLHPPRRLIYAPIRWSPSEKEASARNVHENTAQSQVFYFCCSLGKFSHICGITKDVVFCEDWDFRRERKRALVGQKELSVGRVAWRNVGSRFIGLVGLLSLKVFASLNRNPLPNGSLLRGDI